MMKIALVCTGIGNTYRGLERFTLELFDVVNQELPITLFGSHLNGRANEVSFPCLKHNRFLRVFKGKTRDNYYFQQLSYALSFIPFIAWKDYDIVHYSEPAMGNFLYHAKKQFKFKYKVLFTNWGMEGSYCFRPDHLQEITPFAYKKTVNLGIDPKKVTLLPYGLHTGKYFMNVDKNDLRRKYGVPKNKFVILSVAALNRRHKRIDYLIQEVSRLGNNYFLLVVGYPEEPDLKILGHRLLGENFKSLYVPFDQMPELYHLADLFVITSLIEGFCLAIVEAMCAGLPVIAHDMPNFQWMVGEPRCLADLSRPGNLERKIKEVVENIQIFERIAESNRASAIDRFDWSRLKQDYLCLYEKVLLDDG